MSGQAANTVERGRGEEVVRIVAGGEIGRGVAGFSSTERVGFSRGDGSERQNNLHMRYEQETCSGTWLHHMWLSLPVSLSIIFRLFSTSTRVWSVRLGHPPC